MKLSVRWLDELVGLDGRSPEAIAELLTFHTSGVEEIEKVGEGLEGVVTAKVTAVQPHPNADRLRLCTVDKGDGATIEVVCGAPNVAEGQVICFAPEGLTLPNGLTLGRRKIRGIESAGMICAEDELGLGEGHQGIIVLPEGTEIGRPITEVMKADDVLFEIDNPDLTHRPDLWGHVGMAREIGALLQRRFEPPTAPKADAAFEAAAADGFPVEIQDEDGCRRYVGVVIEGVQDGPSPWWLRCRLEALGMRSLSLLVDITNLVMLEQGQPIHAFDMRDLEGGKIVVRRAKEGEKLTTLDDIERTLVSDDLVIADGSRPVALAGVMGGQNSEVRSDTTTLLLEAANFDPIRVRKTASRLGLRTEASTRFEKALDPENAMAAARRFTELVLEHCPSAKVTRRVTDAYPRPFGTVTIDLPYELVSTRLGMKISDFEIKQSLSALGFRVEEGKEQFHVTVPSWRATKDVEGPADLVEEVGRIRGYAKVPQTAPVGALTPTRPSPLRRLERRMSTRLALDLGYAEIKAYNFYGPKDRERLGIEGVKHVALANPLTEDQDELVQTDLPALLRVVGRNQAREVTGRIFDVTRLTVPPEGDDLPTEIRVVAFARWDREAESDPEGRLFLNLLQDVRAALDAVPVGDLTIREAKDDDRLAPGLPAPLWLHPGRRAAILAGERIVGVAGEVQPKVRRSYDLEGRVAVAELDLEALLASMAEKGEDYRKVHRYPVVPFDVAVIVPRRTPSADVQDAIAGVDKVRVRNVEVFDVYEGKGIPEGERSLALRCELLDPEGTLDQKKADRLRRKVHAALERAGWTVRAG